MDLSHRRACARRSLPLLYLLVLRRPIHEVAEEPEEKLLRQLDAAALRRIFDNILSNAVKYADGDLAVRLLPDGAVTFSNRAPALSRVQAQRLFDRFYTVESARSTTGLGLSIARLLTEKMGGAISADYADGRLCIRVVFP